MLRNTETFEIDILAIGQFVYNELAIYSPSPVISILARWYQLTHVYLYRQVLLNICRICTEPF